MAWADRLDKLPKAAAERDIRYPEARLRTAIVIDPAQTPLTEVAFGLRMTVADDAGVRTVYEITVRCPSGTRTLDLMAMTHVDPRA